VNRKALADRFDSAERREQCRQSVAGDAEHFEVDVFGLSPLGSGLWAVGLGVGCLGVGSSRLA
jgi:hypothetical protein